MGRERFTILKSGKIVHYKFFFEHSPLYVNLVALHYEGEKNGCYTFGRTLEV